MTDTLEYLARPPRLDTGAPPPVVVLFHGYGADMHDLASLGDVMDPRLLVVSVQAPIDLTTVGFPGGRAWFHLHQGPDGGIQYDADGARESVTIAAEFIKAMTSAMECDQDRVAVMGFSQGAMISHALLLKGLVPLAGIAACSGRLVHELIDDADAARQNVPADLPVLLTHGTLDELIPIENGHALRDFYQTTPAHLTYVEEPVGHGIGSDGAAALAAWSRQVLDE